MSLIVYFGCFQDLKKVPVLNMSNRETPRHVKQNKNRGKVIY